LAEKGGFVTVHGLTRKLERARQFKELLQLPDDLSTRKGFFQDLPWEHRLRLLDKNLEKVPGIFDIVIDDQDIHLTGEWLAKRPTYAKEINPATTWLCMRNRGFPSYRMISRAKGPDGVGSQVYELPGSYLLYRNMEVLPSLRVKDQKMMTQTDRYILFEESTNRRQIDKFGDAITSIFKRKWVPFKGLLKYGIRPGTILNRTRWRPGGNSLPGVPVDEIDKAEDMITEVSTLQGEASKAFFVSEREWRSLFEEPPQVYYFGVEAPSKKTVGHSDSSTTRSEDLPLPDKVEDEIEALVSVTDFISDSVESETSGAPSPMTSEPT
jgi:hypothetical protein